jgi:hypothetical protein
VLAGLNIFLGLPEAFIESFRLLPHDAESFCAYHNSVPIIFKRCGWLLLISIMIEVVCRTNTNYNYYVGLCTKE